MKNWRKLCQHYHQPRFFIKSCIFNIFIYVSSFVFDFHKYLDCNGTDRAKMPSADSEKTLLCSVCVGSYNYPRKLSGCIHSFCARCILNYIGNVTGDEEKLGHKF